MALRLPPLSGRRRSALAAAVLLVTAAPTTAGSPEDFAHLLAAAARTDAAQLEERAVELSALPGAASTVLTILETGRLQQGGARTTAEQERVLELIVPHLSAREVVAAVELGSADAPTPAWRAAALELLRPHASAFDLRLLAALVHEPDGEVPPESPHLEAFRAALCDLLEREPRTFSELEWLRFEPVPVRLAAVRAVGRSREVEALDWLRQELSTPELASAALQEIGRVRRGRLLEELVDAAERVRPFLFSPDARQRRHAARAVTALGDELAIPQLVLLLDQGEIGDRRAAHDALRELTGRDLPARASDWTAWHEGELAWLRERGQATLDALRAEEDADVVAAIRSISARGLWRDRIAVELAALALEHPSPAVRGQACLGLARSGSDLALVDLVEALRDPDPGVRAQACAALRALTGRTEPPDAEAWEAVLDGSVLGTG